MGLVRVRDVGTGWVRMRILGCVRMRDEGLVKVLTLLRD